MPTDVPRLRAELLAHYDRHKRDLPWREDADPYRVLVSEVMLQQTRVETVRPYYEAWLERFPDIDALASATESEVLKAWEGLGYYRRARNLHATARTVREERGGRLPSTVEELRTLPGVGDYTAGAVASIAFGVAAPAVDGNVRRVFARWYDVAEPTGAWLRRTAAALVDPERPGDWNQALMELGATVCTPRGPDCALCPVAWACGARGAGTVDARPGAAPRRKSRPATFALAVLRAPDGAVLLERRPEDGLLGGMWSLPEREVSAPADAAAAAVDIAAALSVGSEPPEWRELPPVRHRFTHIDALYVPRLFDVQAPPREPDDARLRWVGSAEREAMALPVAQRAVLEGL